MGDVVKHHQAEDVADARDGLPQGEGGGIVVPGSCADGEFEVLEQSIVLGAEGQVALDGFWHCGGIKALGHTVAVGFGGDLRADLGQGVLSIGVLSVSSKLSACAHQVRAAPEQGTGGAHPGRGDRGRGEPATSEEQGNLFGIDLGVCGRAAMDGLPRAGMPQDEGTALLRTEIGELVPGEETFHGHHQARTRGSNGLENGGRGGLHIAVQEEFTPWTHDADVHGTGLQSDTTVQLVLGGVESPGGLLLVRAWLFPKSGRISNSPMKSACSNSCGHSALRMNCARQGVGHDVSEYDRFPQVAAAADRA